MEAYTIFKHHDTLKFVISLILFFCMNTVSAQDGTLPDDFFDDVTDVPPPAPINQYVFGTFVFASMYGAYVINKKRVKNINT